MLSTLLTAHPALATGATLVRRNDRNVLAVIRIDASARREYVAAFNSGTGAARVAVRTSTPSATWTPLLGTDSPVTSRADGTVDLVIPPLGSVLFRANADLPTAAPQRPRVRVAGDDLTDFWTVSATVPGTAPVSVSFGVRRPSGRWQRLATDDSPPYRAFLDPARFRRNERVHVVAVVRALDGRTAVSAVSPFAVRRR